MHIKYHDIIRKIRQRPLWWLDGVPRYEPFSPEPLGVSEIALVHTECQDCGLRYDVAIGRRPPHYQSLRNILAYENRLDVGDPPFACQELGSKTCGAGYCMSSLEIRILEFWESTTEGIRQTWKRNSEMERNLADAGYYKPCQNSPPEPVFLRLHDSEERDGWQRARQEGNFLEMVRLLEEVGCERPAEVANMLDLERRADLFRKEFWALSEERLGKRG